MGKSTNERIAQKWLDSFRGLFESQFAAIGAYEGADVTSSGGILKESQSWYYDIYSYTHVYMYERLTLCWCDSFKFYASGRRHCTGLLATIDLRKRQDLFSLALSLVDLSTIRDTVVCYHYLPIISRHYDNVTILC
jgi:hypothetical protein